MILFAAARINFAAALLFNFSRMLNINEELLDKEITGDALKLLLIMATYANKGGESVFPSNATLVAKTKFAEKKVIQLKKELISANLLTENTEKRKENLAKKLAKTKKEFTNVSKVYAVNSAFIGKFVSKNTETARFERNCQFGKLPKQVVTQIGSYLEWQSKYWVSIETSIEEFEKKRIELGENTQSAACVPNSDSFLKEEIKNENPTRLESENRTKDEGGRNFDKSKNTENEEVKPTKEEIVIGMINDLRTKLDLQPIQKNGSNFPYNELKGAATMIRLISENNAAEAKKTGDKAQSITETITVLSKDFETYLSKNSYFLTMATPARIAANYVAITDAIIAAKKKPLSKAEKAKQNGRVNELRMANESEENFHIRKCYELKRSLKKQGLEYSHLTPQNYKDYENN